jgi:acyl carrier protein
MRKSDFLKKMHDSLEISSVENLTEETILKQLGEYNSMFLLTIIAFVDENFEMQISTEQLLSVTTIRSLMDLIGYEKFED